jgi:N-acetyl-gamma-glutamyl-phosphate reductase
MIKAAIAGATGYTGSELLRILDHHPGVTVTKITSETNAGKPLSAVFPQFRDRVDLTYEPLEPDHLTEGVDFVFLALPHTLSMQIAERVTGHAVKVIDLSGDFRLKNAQPYKTWYGVEHTAPALLKEAVYGLTELNREAVRAARFLANPGCYPTCALLGLAPLIRERIVQLEGIVVDAKSGVSGAGKNPRPHLHYPETNEALMAYRVAEHPHTPEIEQEMERLCGKEIRISFTPHLIPLNRGLLCTVYGALAEKLSTEELVARYRAFYADEPFVQVLPAGAYPNVRNVKGTNRCSIGLKVDDRTGKVIVISVIDNLVKGASGQAVQNMNLMMGFEETAGLDFSPLVP